MAAAKAARRNTTVHDLYLLNDPFQDPCIGRRTGVPLNIRARKDSNGFDNVDDYFPDSDPEDENIGSNEQESSEKDLLVGRRTGVPLNINPRKDSKGFELVEDYFPDPEGETDEPREHGNQVEDFAETASSIVKEMEVAETPEAVVTSPNDTGTIIKLPASLEPTPQSNEPIKKRLSFAHGKSPTEAEPHKEVQTRIMQDHTKLITDSDGGSDSEIDVVDGDDGSQKDRQESDNLQSSTAHKDTTVGKENATNTKQKKNPRTILIEDDEVIDVEAIEEEETFLTIGNTTRNAGGVAPDKFPISPEAESFVMSESFVLEGTKHKTMSPEYGSCSDSQPEQSELPAAPREKKSKIPVRKKGVPIGTKQKGTTVPTGNKQKGTTVGIKKKMEHVEQVAENDNVDEGKNQAQEVRKFLRRKQPDTKQRSTRRRQNDETEKADCLDDDSNKEKAGGEEVHVKGRKSLRGKVQNTQRRLTREMQKKVKESENVEQETDAQYPENDDEDRDNDDDGRDEVANINKGQVTVSSVDEEKLVDSKDVKAQTGEAERKQKRRAKSLPGTKQPQTSTRKVKKSDDKAVVASDEEVFAGDKRENNTVDDKGERQSRGRKSVPSTKHEEKKVTRGRKQGNRANLECEVDDGDDKEEDSDEKRPAGRMTRVKQQENGGGDNATKKGADIKKNQKQGENVQEGSDQADTAKLSGRKTRAQRKKEADAKLNSCQEKERDTEGGVEDNHDKVELNGRKTRAQRKREADAEVYGENGNGKEKNGDAQHDPEDSPSKASPVSENIGLKVTRKGEKKSDVDEKELNKEKDYRIETGLQRKEGTGKASEEEKGGGSETKESRVRGQEVLTDAIGELDEDSISANQTLQESVGNSSSVSSNVSSNSESKRRTGTKRRKHSSMLPPYARRANRTKSSKASCRTNSQDSSTETELRRDAKKPRLQQQRTQPNSGEETSKKAGKINSRKGCRAARTGRKSDGGNKSVALGKKSRKSEGTNGKSTSSTEGIGEDDGTFVDVDAACDGDGNDSVQEAGGVEGRSFEEIPLDSATPGQFPVPSAKSGTALKSILKSGGRIGRANAASRKRQINSDKSHSGGSDADDESAQPAKQPNRKRLSTVSFASSPFVRESPADLTQSKSSRRSPLASLSFVSKDSSHHLSDNSFTPGSGRTGRASVGSASGVSSAHSAESDIDPEEEVTLTNDDKQQEGSADEGGTRRSKRTIVPPLQYWKNERIDYERRKSGGWCVKGVIRNPTPTPKIRKKSKPKRTVTKKQNHVDSSEEEVDNEELDGFQEIINPTSTVFNPEKKEDVEMDLFHAPGMLKYTNPAGKPASEDDPLIVHKFISQPLFGGGQVILRPGAEKGRQFVRNDTMVFYVIKGKIMVTIHQSSVVLNTGSSFFVPQGNSYNIKNLKQTEAKLMFVQIKG